MCARNAEKRRGSGIKIRREVAESSDSVTPDLTVSLNSEVVQNHIDF